MFLVSCCLALCPMGPWQAFRFLSFCRAAASLSNDHFLQFFWPSDNVSHVHVPFRYDEPNPPILPYSLPLYLAVSSLSISLSNPRTTVDTILSFIVPLSNDKTGNDIDTILVSVRYYRLSYRCRTIKQETISIRYSTLTIMSISYDSNPPVLTHI